MLNPLGGKPYRASRFHHREQGRAGAAEAGFATIWLISAVLAASLFAVMAYTGRIPFLQRQENLETRKLEAEFFMAGVLDVAKNALAAHSCLNESFNLDPVNCDLTHPRNLERLLLSVATVAEVQQKLYPDFARVNPPAGSPPRCDAAKKAAHLCYGADANGQRGASVEAIGFDIPLNQLAEAHPIRILNLGLSRPFTSLRIDFQRYRTSGGSEAKIGLRVTASSGLLRAPYELNAQVSVFPRELNTFSLILAGDLNLKAPATTAGGSASEPCSNAHERRAMNAHSWYVPSVSAAGGSTIRFLSPVYVNGSIRLPSTPAPSDPSTWYPVVFEQAAVVGGGSVCRDGQPLALASSASSLVDASLGDPALRFGGFQRGVRVDGFSDPGLDNLFLTTGTVSTPVDPALMMACIDRNARRTELPRTAASVLLFKKLSTAPAAGGQQTLAYTLGLTERDEFNPAVLTVTTPSTDPAAPAEPLRDARFTMKNPRGLHPVVKLQLRMPGFGLDPSLAGNNFARELLFSRDSEGELTFEPKELTLAKREVRALQAEKLAFEASRASELQRLNDECSRLHGGGLRASVCGDADSSVCDGGGGASCSMEQTALVSSLGSADSQALVTEKRRIENALAAAQARETAARTLTWPKVTITSAEPATGAGADRLPLQFRFERLSEIPDEILVDVTPFDFGTTATGEDRPHPESAPPTPDPASGPNGIPNRTLRFTKTATSAFSLSMPALAGSNSQAANPALLALTPPAAGRITSAQQAAITNFNFFAADPAAIESSCNNGVSGGGGGSVAAGGSAFGLAGWSPNYAASSRRSFHFSAPAGVPAAGATVATPGAIDVVFGANEQAQDGTFHVFSVARKCVIRSSARVVSAFLTCDELTIEPRSAPLWMIGTFIVGKLTLDPRVVTGGVTWASIYDAQAIEKLREQNVLDRYCSDCQGLVVDPADPIWNPVPSRIGQIRKSRASPESLRAKADPFTWTTVDPVCGLAPGAAATTCGIKGRMNRTQLVEILRELRGP